MKTFVGAVVLLIGSLIAGTGISAQEGGGRPSAQQGGPPVSKTPPTISSALDSQLRIVEFEVVGIADAMPEDKYSFAPTNGKFDGVRTFAQEVKHIATVNDLFFNVILGQASAPGPLGPEALNGPDSIQTKAQIIQYLKDSFALGHKAIATITPDNAVTLLPTPPISFLNTRLSVAAFSCTHAMDHYGQMVEYLRDNGLVPPTSRQQPPANPQPKP